MKYQEVKNYCEEKGFTKRKDRYKIMEEYFGVSAGTCKEIVSFDRQLRDVLEVDAKGIELEKEWHTPIHQIKFGQEINKQLIKDREKYA